MAESARERLVEVLPPSKRGETAAVARAAALVAIASLLWIGSAAMRDRLRRDPVGALLPYQVAFAELSSRDQRALRELHEGAIEAMRLRGEEGRWPEPSRLAAEGIPPFADDGVERGLRRFHLVRDAYHVQYVGESTTAGACALLFQVLEPQPGDLEGSDPRVPVPYDEEHRRLSDGTLLHVYFWIGPERAASSALVRDPARDGFKQVRSGAAVVPTRPARNEDDAR